jgi:hypothetical protein
MVTVTRRYSPTRLAGAGETAALHLGVDTTREAVHLDAEVIPAQSFARLLLVLGDVVAMDDRQQFRDHSRYQGWVREQYFSEVGQELRQMAEESSTLLTLRTRAALEVEVAKRTFDDASREVWQHHNMTARRAFWAWLSDHDRAAWLVLDPIVSVQPDATFFEAFSGDESSYVRVELPHSALKTQSAPVCGTTNIDFSVDLEREFARARPYRPLRLTVGPDSVGVDAGEVGVLERKIDLPDSWVRGLVEVQAALSLSPTSITISSGALADVIAHLESKRERQGPRSIVITMTPGQLVTATVEPWGDVFTLSSAPFSGTESKITRVWGRRRLRVLLSLLPFSPTVNLSLLDSGMPSFWSIVVDGLTLTLGLSGWTAQDWAGKARFSALVPASTTDPGLVREASNVLAERLSVSSDELAVELNMSPLQSRLILQRLCVLGLAMFDPTRLRFRHRVLFPEIDFSADSDIGREERVGIELYQSRAVTIDSDEYVSDERVVKARVATQKDTSEVTVIRDIDGRVLRASCMCSHYRHNKLRLGPCRHLVATVAAGG